MGYQENEKGEVVVTMTRDDWLDLLLALGYARGAASRQGSVVLARKIAGLVNRINEGNPRFRQYLLDEEPPTDASSTH